ncbi:MAG: hypothetical protein ACFCGT_13020, partial [Sandaracinaceae bacterium]
MLRRVQRLIPAAFVLALLGSVGLHLPAYVGLGALKEHLAKLTAAEATVVELEFVDRASDDAAEDRSDADAEEGEEESDRVEEAEDSAVELEPEARPTLPSPERPERPERQPEAEPEPEPELATPTPTPARPPPPPPPDASERYAIEQHSPDPPEEAPENARHVAEENRRVEEETIARARNLHLDDPDPEASAPDAPEEGEEAGDSEEDVSADLQDAEGTDRRSPTTAEATREPPPEVAEARPSESPRPPEARTAEGARRVGGEGSGARRVAGGGAEAQGGGEEPQVVTVTDGAGTFRVQVPQRPEGAGPGGGGGPAVAGRGRGR